MNSSNIINFCVKSYPFVCKISLFYFFTTSVNTVISNQCVTFLYYIHVYITYFITICVNTDSKLHKCFHVMLQLYVSMLYQKFILLKDIFNYYFNFQNYSH